MRVVSATLKLLILLTCLHRPVWACTIFKVTCGSTTFVGNNEDDNNPDTKVWFLVPEKGKTHGGLHQLGDHIPRPPMAPMRLTQQFGHFLMRPAEAVDQHHAHPLPIGQQAERPREFWLDHRRAEIVGQRKDHP